MNLNKITIAGRIGKDIELKSLPSGSAVCNFTVASNRTWKDKDGQKQESTEWFNVVFFGKTAEIIHQYFRKGKEIYIEGRVQTRSWEGQDGNKHYRTEVVGESFQFVGFDGDDKKPAQPKRDEQPAPAGEPAIEYPEEEVNVDDILF